jgi:methylisocitrate lyase
MTEFGKTPLYNRQELADWGADMILYPLSAFRAMNRAAENVYRALLEDGDQNAVVDTMQTRVELYDYLGYHEYEQKLDELFARDKKKEGFCVD